LGEYKENNKKLEE